MKKIRISLIRSEEKVLVRHPYIWIHRKIYHSRIFHNYSIIHQILIVFLKLLPVNRRRIVSFVQQDLHRPIIKAKKL